MLENIKEYRVSNGEKEQLDLRMKQTEELKIWVAVQGL